MKLADEVEALHEKLAQLEKGPAVTGDWNRLEARAARAVIHAQNQLTAVQTELIHFVRAEPPDPRWYQLQSAARTIRELMDELRMIGMCAHSRLFEIEAELSQSEFTNWTHGRSA